MTHDGAAGEITQAFSLAFCAQHHAGATRSGKVITLPSLFRAAVLMVKAAGSQ
ncbi:MAG: hypothetical protein WCF90_00760 [Methanomicrobiales archaeon]